MTETLRTVDGDGALDRILEQPLAVLYKHSTRCGLSAGALIEMRQFAERHPAVPVYMIDVISQRALSQKAAQRVGIQHESPQAIVLLHGTAVWDASHFRVSCSRLESAFEEHGLLSEGDEMTVSGDER